MDLRRHPPRPAVRVEPGSGTVLQFGSVVVLLAATREAVPFEAELCAALAPWAGDHPPAAGDAVRAMATLLIKYRVGAPALGAAVQDTAGMRLLLHGAVRAMAGGQAGKVELSGLRAATWVDQLLTDPTGSIRFTLDDAPPPSGDGTELMTDRAGRRHGSRPRSDRAARRPSPSGRASAAARRRDQGGGQPGGGPGGSPRGKIINTSVITCMIAASRNRETRHGDEMTLASKGRTLFDKLTRPKEYVLF
jgi:hypothetical protein